MRFTDPIVVKIHTCKVPGIGFYASASRYGDIVCGYRSEAAAVSRLVDILVKRLGPFDRVEYPRRSSTLWVATFYPPTTTTELQPKGTR